MSHRQSLSGDRFEDCFATSASKKLGIPILADDHSERARKAFQTLADEDQWYSDIVARATDKAVQLLIEYDPRMLKAMHIRFWPNSGRDGDPTDIAIILPGNEKIRISAKHRSNEVKSGRLSPTNRIGKWFGYPTSGTYMHRARELLGPLHGMKGTFDSLGARKHQLYSDMMKAFVDEFKFQAESNLDAVPNVFLHYLGRFDHYRVRFDNGRKNQLRIETINIHGTLPGPKILIPRSIKEIKSISDSTVEVVFDNGWTTRIRIHNGESRIKASLKLTITVVDHPQAAKPRFYKLGRD